MGSNSGMHDSILGKSIQACTIRRMLGSHFFSILKYEISSSMPRFKPGDVVRIAATEPTPFANLKATVQKIQLHDHGVTTLDRYVVVFEWGEEQTFYDVQLEQISKPSDET